MKISVARRHLPERLKKLSDEEVISLVNQLELLAELFIETFESAGSKKQRGVIDTSGREDENGKSN